MTTPIDDPRTGDLVTMVYRDVSLGGRGWLAEVQQGIPGAWVQHGEVKRALTKLGAGFLARRLLRRAVRIERAKESQESPILVRRIRPSSVVAE